MHRRRGAIAVLRALFIGSVALADLPLRQSAGLFPSTRSEP